jgi:hypothetical protein
MPTYVSTSVLTGIPMTVTSAFPDANAVANASGFQMSLATVSRPLRSVACQVSWPALSAHTNSASVVTLTLQDSTDNSNWSNLNPLTQVQLPGVATNGAAADSYRMALPSHLRDYLRVQIAVPSGGPGITDKSVTISLVVA